MRKRRLPHRPLPEPANQVAHVESLTDSLDSFDVDDEVRRLQSATSSRTYASRRAG